VKTFEVKMKLRMNNNSTCCGTHGERAVERNGCREQLANRDVRVVPLK